MSKDKKYESAEYSPTPAQQLPAFRGGIPHGYVCPKCGHMELEVDETFELTCKKCFSQWLVDHDFQQLSAIKDVIQQDKDRQEALEPTKKYEPGTCDFKEATTKIIKKPEKETEKTSIMQKMIQYFEGWVK
jgi:hypothetical protein